MSSSRRARERRVRRSDGRPDSQGRERWLQFDREKKDSAGRGRERQYNGENKKEGEEGEDDDGGLRHDVEAGRAPREGRQRSKGRGSGLQAIYDAGEGGDGGSKGGQEKRKEGMALAREEGRGAGGGCKWRWCSGSARTR